MSKLGIRIGILFGSNQWELVVTPFRWRLGLSTVGAGHGIDTLQLFVGPIGFLVARGNIWVE